MNMVKPAKELQWRLRYAGASLDILGQLYPSDAWFGGLAVSQQIRHLRQTEFQLADLFITRKATA